MPSFPTRASPLSLMLAAMRVKSPFSHSAWFGFMASRLLAAAFPGTPAPLYPASRPGKIG
jgi:hypothetical protein